MNIQKRWAHLIIEELNINMSEGLRGSSYRWFAAQLGFSP
jgi:hypothetical protein